MNIPVSPMINRKFEKDVISQSSKPVLNINPINIDEPTDSISQRSMDITNRQLFENKKYEAASNTKGSLNPVIDHQNAENNFKKAIQLIDAQDDKIKELLMHSPKYIPNKNINLEMFEKRVEEKTIKDIITNNIYNYTDGNREDYYTEGSRRSYSSSVNSMPREIKMPQKKSSVEKEMTPEDHSDFRYGDDFFQDDNVDIKMNQYNSEFISKKSNVDKLDIRFRKKITLS
jgi:hypothetical protein